MVDLNDRIEVLLALKHNLDSRVYSAGIPDAMYAHAERIEKAAEELYDKAQRIRVRTKEDIEGMLALRKECVRVEVEICACKVLRLQDAEVTKGYLESLVEKFLQGM